MCILWGPLRSVLRKNSRAIRANGYVAAGGHSVTERTVGIRVIAEPVAEKRIITVPVTVEAHPPASAAREADGVIAIATVCEVQHHHYIIAISALLPAVKCNELVRVVYVMHVHVLSPQAARVVEPVAAQLNQVAV